MMVSMWSWNPKDVAPGESVGLCVRPAEIPTAHASCWLFKKNRHHEYEGPTSYLVDSSYLTAGARLEDMNKVTIYPVPGMKGQWMCDTPTNIFGRVQVSCARFTPKVFKIEDPSFEPHEDVTVMTYLTARLTGRIDFESNNDSGLSSSGFHSADSAFESFKFDVEDISLRSFMGGMVGYSSGLAACLVLGVTSLAF